MLWLKVLDSDLGIPIFSVHHLLWMVINFILAITQLNREYYNFALT